MTTFLEMSELLSEGQMTRGQSNDNPKVLWYPQTGRSMGNHNQTKTRVVVLISADAEWRALRLVLPGMDEQSSPYGNWFRVEMGGYAPIFLHGGWGKIAAAGSTQYAIDRWQPELIVNLGTCGGFEGEIERDEIILVDHTLVYDIIEQMGDPEGVIAHYSTEIDLSWLQPPYPHAVRRTLLVSGDRDLLAEQIPELKSLYGAVAGDWESGAIAFVAKRNGVRTLILRGVTDLVGPSGGEAYGNMALFEAKTRQILERLVGALPLWLQASGINSAPST
jgi:adenosylhomocysteine nucleosidase